MKGMRRFGKGRAGEKKASRARAAGGFRFGAGSGDWLKKVAKTRGENQGKALYPESGCKSVFACGDPFLFTVEA